MLIPTLYDDDVEEYWHLVDHVTLWDVAVERQLEIKGPDAARFTQLLTPRDLSATVPEQCKYVLICAPDGGIVNDPILLKLAEDHFWLSLADSDALLYAKGVQAFANMDVELGEPDVSPLQIQGPKSKPLVAQLFGDEVADQRYYWHKQTELDGIPVVVSRTGWTAELGYEVYLRDSSRALDLWDAIIDAGEAFDLRVTAPSDQRRLEAGIFNYGNDMDVTNNPYEVTGLERLVELDNDNEVVSRAALERIRTEGVTRKLVGVTIEGPPLGHVAGGLLAGARRRHGGRSPDIGRTLPAPRRQPRLRLGADRAGSRRHRAGDRVARGRDDGNRHADPVPRSEEGDPRDELKSGPGVATLRYDDRLDPRPALALPGWAALLAVFLLPALESSAFIGFLFPGEIAVILGGVAAAAGRMPLPVMIVAAILGAVIGDSIGYVVGKRWGIGCSTGRSAGCRSCATSSSATSRRRRSSCETRGPHAVFIGRFTAALRVLVPGLSGMAGLPYPTFLLYNVLGAILWGTTFAVLGYVAKNAWERVAADASQPGLRCSRSSRSG